MNQKVKGLIAVALLFAVVLFSGCPPEDYWEPGYLLCSDKCEGESSGDVKNRQGSVVSGYEYVEIVSGYSVSIVGTNLTGVI
jgi:hypothetical protein